MALKIRQGLEANRSSITPESGELIYTTDDKLVYVGDGVTPGGNIISGAVPVNLNDLADVDFTTLSVGQVLKYDGVNWVNGTDATGGGGGGGATYSISSEISVTPNTAVLRLTGSDSTVDNISITGVGAVVTSPDPNTIQIDTSANGSVNSGLINRLSFYETTGTTLSDTIGLTYNLGTQTLQANNLNVNNAIFAGSANFRILNTINNQLLLGGFDTNGVTEIAGYFTSIDTNTYVEGSGNTILSVHNSAAVNAINFVRRRGTLAAPLGVQTGDLVGEHYYVADTDGTGDFARIAAVGASINDSFTPGSGIIRGTYYIGTSDNTGVINVGLFVNGVQDTYAVNNLYAGTGLFTPSIDTSDSSAIQIVPTAVFNSDVEIQNNLTVTNRVTATEFVSTSLGTPEIVTAQNLDITVASKGYSFRTDGGVVLPFTSSAPPSPTAGAIYLADKDNWDPLSTAGSTPYLVIWSGTAWVSVVGA